MEKTPLLIFLLASFFLCGCSLPAAARYGEIYSITRKEEKIEGAFGSTKKVVSIKDFRESELYEEDIPALKEEVEEYITAHPDLDGPTKNNLRELKVTEGLNKEEVKLLLGEPDKVAGKASGEIWIYRINRLRVFTFFIIPLFPVHESYYLRFKDDSLSAIERHSLKQTIRQTGGPGVHDRTSQQK